MNPIDPLVRGGRDAISPCWGAFAWEEATRPGVIAAIDP